MAGHKKNLVWQKKKHIKPSLFLGGGWEILIILFFYWETCFSDNYQSVDFSLC